MKLNIENIIVNERTFSFMDNYTYNGYLQTYFSVNSFEEFSTFAKDEGFEIKNSFEVIENYIIENNKESKYMLLPVIGILILTKHSIYEECL